MPQGGTVAGLLAARPTAEPGEPGMLARPRRAGPGADRRHRPAGSRARARVRAAARDDPRGLSAPLRRPLVVRTADDDLALLLGDQLYALGLSRLAALGDLDAVAELADVISLVAQAHSASDRELAQAVWEAGAISVGWGSSDAHAEAKERARAHERGAHRALRAAAASVRDGAS